MAPDRGAPARFGTRLVLAVTGSSSAMKATESFETAAGSRIRIPTITGALSLKGAASGTSSANPGRHAQDGVVLFACREARNINDSPSKSARANINLLIRGLGNERAWSISDLETRRLAIAGIRRLRPDFRPPVAVLPSRPQPSRTTPRAKTTPASNRGSFAPRTYEGPESPPE